MTKRKMLLSGAAGLLMTFAGAASADNNATPTSEAMSTPTLSWAENEQAAALGRLDTIVVVPDAEDYAHAKPTNLALPFHIEVEVSKSKWRIQESYITIGRAPLESGGQIYACCGAMGEFNPYNYAAYVDHGETKHVDQDAWWTVKVDDNSLATRARNACRVLRKELEGKGLSRNEIFSKDRKTTLPTEFHYVARVGHWNDNRDTWEGGERRIYWKQSQLVWADIKVICQKDARSRVTPDPTPPSPSASDDLQIGFQVKQAALAITPKKHEGKCPMKLHLNPTIETNGKGTVRYRFRDHLGNKSQEFQVKFDKADVKFLEHVVEIDAKGKPKGLGLATPQAAGGELGIAAPSDPDVIKGYFQLEIVKPHKKLSKVSDYSVKCVSLTAGEGIVAETEPEPEEPKLPDLVIEDVQPHPTLPTKLLVTVTNQGAGASAPTTLRSLHWMNMQAMGRNTALPAIEAGESEVILADLWAPIVEANQVYVRADDPNEVPEANEGNNSFKVK